MDTQDLPVLGWNTSTVSSSEINSPGRECEDYITATTGTLQTARVWERLGRLGIYDEVSGEANCQQQNDSHNQTNDGDGLLLLVFCRLRLLRRLLLLVHGADLLGAGREG